MSGDQIPQNALFSGQKRPIPVFNHALHEKSLGEVESCAKCHHVLDVRMGLVYSEGEEAACSECHTFKLTKNMPSMKDANHASCTKCHRDLIKAKKPAGPTTCGECHETLLL